jgi:pyrroloquinoline-quinone synthase
MDLFRELESVRERCNVLRHPFYRRWSAGELTLEHLATYSGQYRHAVVALAAASASASASADDARLGSGLAQHAEEEAAHIALFDRFVSAVGGDATATATLETDACTQIWARDERSLLPTLVALYAIESSQPAISTSKRDGLVAHYGFRPDGDATCYFDVHAVRDIDHAAQHRATIQPRLAGADLQNLRSEGEAVLKANWALLDGVQRLTA